MFSLFKIDSRFHAFWIFILASLLTAACQDSSSTASRSGQTQFEVAGDHAIGNPDAKVTLVEYASVVCKACANWHLTVYPDIKKTYIDTGKVRFVFREFPTSPETWARAGFLIANCADEDKFMENISLQFKRQKHIFASPDPRQEYLNIAKAAGLSEADFLACLSNEEEVKKYEAVVQGGIDAGVNKTPTFFINGRKENIFTFEEFEAKIAPLLGEEISTPTPSDSQPSDAETDKDVPAQAE